LKTRQGKCINSEKCPLSREEEIFTVNDGAPFECPICGGELIEYFPGKPAESLAAAMWEETLELPQPMAWEVPAEAPAGWKPEPAPEADPELLPEPELQAEEHRESAPVAAAERARESHNETPKTAAPMDREWWDPDSSDAGFTPSAPAAPAPRKTEKAPAVILVAAVLVVLLAAAGFYAVTHKLIVLPGLTLDAKGSQTTILRISGSNLMGDSLMPAMAEAFLKYRGATGVHSVAGDHPGEKVVLGTLPRDLTVSAIVIDPHGTESAFTCMAERSCDIGMAERRISPEEASRLSPLSGDMYSSEQEHVVGLDGIAVIVNAANPMNTLPEDRVRELFSGEMTNMATATSPIGPVTVYARDDTSAIWEMFSADVLEGRPLAAGAKRIDTASALADAVAGDPFGIGIVEFPFIRGTKPIAVSDNGALPLLPTRLTVATEDYPLTRRLYLYTSGNSSNPNARQFAAFALSELGQEVVRAAGFVGQNVEPLSAAAPVTAPEEYRQLTANARRLSVDFRFLADSTQLDSKGLADMDRVYAAIQELRLNGEQLMLFGFSDRADDHDRGQALSLELAKTVESQLAQKGISPSVVKGYGAALLVASSETAEGRRRNRRVEVWVKE
jgi:phosphate transport system substrate-binding protein